MILYTLYLSMQYLNDFTDTQASHKSLNLNDVHINLAQKVNNTGLYKQEKFKTWFFYEKWKKYNLMGLDGGIQEHRAWILHFLN